MTEQAKGHAGYPVILGGDHAEFEREWAAGGRPDNERPDWPLPSFDAEDWAQAFCNICRKRGFNPAANHDLDWARGWFANALMRGYDEHAGRSSAENARLRAQRTEFDCRYTLGDVADFSGQHCPPEQPCMRCQRDQLVRITRKIVDAWVGKTEPLGDETFDEYLEPIIEEAYAVIAAVENKP